MCVAGLLDAMRSKLPASVRIVWQCLENHADHNRRWSMPLEGIVKEVNLSIETVVRAVRILAQHGIVLGKRAGPGRNATEWHMLRSYDPSPHNGGIEPQETPQPAGMNGEGTRHSAGIKQPLTPQSDGMKIRGSPQNAGITIPAKCGDLTHQVSKNPPKRAPKSPSPDGAGDRLAHRYDPDGYGQKQGTRADGTNPRAMGTNPRNRPRWRSGAIELAYKEGLAARATEGSISELDQDEQAAEDEMRQGVTDFLVEKVRRHGTR